MIDFRSDTVSKPTKKMLEAMFNATVGDDVFVEDETVNKLEQKAADMFCSRSKDKQSRVWDSMISIWPFLFCIRCIVLIWALLHGNIPPGSPTLF